MSPLFVLVPFAILLVSALAWFLFRLSSAASAVPDIDWLKEFSPTRYRPMARLLSEADFRYAASQGVDPARLRTFRAERRRIFSTYLSNLVRDFNTLHAAARTFLLSSEVDRPELAVKLIQVRANFQKALFALHFRLLLHRLGLMTVDITPLVRAVESMHADLTAFSPALGTASV